MTPGPHNKIVPQEHYEALLECREALQHLVTLRDGPRSIAYETQKPQAWSRARKAVEGATPP